MNMGWAMVALVVAGLYWLQGVLIPLALAILLTFLLSPVVNTLQRRGLGRVPAVLVTVALALSVLGCIGYLDATKVSIYWRGELVYKPGAIRGKDFPEYSPSFNNSSHVIRSSTCNVNFNFSRARASSLDIDQVKFIISGRIGHCPNSVILREESASAAIHNGLIIRRS